jgi:hypothetical protein
VVAGIVTPVILVVPTVVFGAKTIEGTAQAVAVAVFFFACCFNMCLVRRWGAPQWLMALVAAYPLVTLVYWLTIGSSIQFGDAQDLQPLYEHAALCWDRSSALSGCLQALHCNPRLWAGSLYHGLRIFLYGNEPLVTVCWGSTVLLSTAMMALPGLSLSGLTRAEVLGVFIAILVWPDFLNMTSNIGRDILILWGILAWYSGIRYTLRLGGPVGVMAVLLGIALLAFCRPVYLLICTLDLSVLFVGGTVLNRRRSAAIGTASLFVVMAVVCFLLTRADVPWLNAIAETGSSQVSNNARAFNETTGNLGGWLASLTGFGFLISIPIRLVMAVMGPFPWTSRALFYAEIGGFNGSLAVLGCHIVKSIVALSAILSAGTLLWRGLRKYGLRSLVDNTNAPLFIAIAFAACSAGVGYNRYISISFPFLAATILNAKKGLPGNRSARHIMWNAGIVVVAGTVIILAIYLVKF